MRIEKTIESLPHGASLGVSRKKAGNYELRAETIGFQQFVKIATLQISADEN
jgi:hypothetical protein